MKILVFSDSHGNEDNMVRAVERERPSTLDAIVHLGDGWRDAEALHRLYPRIPLEQVPGNCDLGRFEERERVVFFGDCRVLLCHGHTLGVKSSLLRASYEARERGAQALLYGHVLRGADGRGRQALPRKFYFGIKINQEMTLPCPPNP